MRWAVPVPCLVARLHERNNWFVDSHHPLRETIILQTGEDAEQRDQQRPGRSGVARQDLDLRQGGGGPAQRLQVAAPVGDGDGFLQRQQISLKVE